MSILNPGPLGLESNALPSELPCFGFSLCLVISLSLSLSISLSLSLSLLVCFILLSVCLFVYEWLSFSISVCLSIFALNRIRRLLLMMYASAIMAVEILRINLETKIHLSLIILRKFRKEFEKNNFTKINYSTSA